MQWKLEVRVVRTQTEGGLDGPYTVVPWHAVIHSGYIRVDGTRATVRVIAFEAGVGHLRVTCQGCTSQEGRRSVVRRRLGSRWRRCRHRTRSSTRWL